MTLLEVLAAGKPFRRKGSGQGFTDPSFQSLTLSKQDLLAGDWELPAELVRIDVSDAKAALQTAGFTLAQIKAIADTLRGLNK